MFINSIKLFLFQKKFRRLNKYNFTQIMNFCDLNKVIIGKKTYGEINVTDYSPEDTKLYIGCYCSIAPNVRFLLGGEHRLHTISTYPFKVKCFGASREAGSKGDIVVKDDVWIGEGAIICSGITIGQGAVIGAGSVVTKDIEPYAIVGGNPAHFISWRMDEQSRKQLCELNIVRLFDSFSQEDIPYIYNDVSDNVLKELMEINNE